MTSIKKIERDPFEKIKKNFFMLWLLAKKGANGGPHFKGKLKLFIS